MPDSYESPTATHQAASIQLPRNWKAATTSDELIIVPPAGIAGGAFLLSVLGLALGRYASSPGTWWSYVWMSVSALLFLRFTVSLLQQKWLLSTNSLTIQRSILGIPWRKMVFRDAVLTASQGADGAWSFQICDSDHVRILVTPDSLEDAVMISDALTASTGWCVNASDGSSVLLREMLNQALMLNDLNRLRSLLARKGASSVLVLLWRGQPTHRKQRYIELLSQITDLPTYLMEVANSDDGQVRATAMELLGLLGDLRAIPRLRQALTDPHESVRIAAATVLGQLRDRESVTVLCEALKYGGNLPRTAAWALGEIGDSAAAPEIMDILCSGDRLAEGELRQTAATALGQMRDPRSVPVLCVALSDPVPAVRVGAAEALGKFASADTVSSLRLALSDSEPEVVAIALRVLADRGDLETQEHLPRCLSHTSSLVRCAAVRALGKIGGDQAVHFLREMLRDGNGELRLVAAEALSELARSERGAPVQLLLAVPLLKKKCSPLSTERSDIKRACLNALTQIQRRTASIKDLPLPAALGEHSVATLPRTVDPSQIADSKATETPSLRRIR